MKLIFTVEVELSKVEGKFESKEALSQELSELVDDALAGACVTGWNDGQYEVTSVDVS